MYEHFRTVVSEFLGLSAVVICPAVLRHGSASVHLEFIVRSMCTVHGVVLIVKVRVAQLVKFPAFYGARNFI